MSDIPKLEIRTRKEIFQDIITARGKIENVGKLKEYYETKFITKSSHDAQIEWLKKEISSRMIKAEDYKSEIKINTYEQVLNMISRLEQLEKEE